MVRVTPGPVSRVAEPCEQGLPRPLWARGENQGCRGKRTWFSPTGSWERIQDENQGLLVQPPFCSLESFADALGHRPALALAWRGPCSALLGLTSRLSWCGRWSCRMGPSRRHAGNAHSQAPTRTYLNQKPWQCFPEFNIFMNSPGDSDTR